MRFAPRRVSPSAVSVVFDESSRLTIIAETTLFIAKKVSEWVEEMEGVRKDKGTANITESSVQE